MSADVRPAAPADLDRCAALLQAARREVDGKRGAAQLVGPWATQALDGATVSRWAGAPGRALLAGLLDEEVCGVAAARAVGVTGHIECCYVDPPGRGNGLGAALLGALTSWCATQGCTEIDGAALPGDRLTKQLYESGGFKARLLVMHRPLTA